jgi:hypothetical protein
MRRGSTGGRPWIERSGADSRAMDHGSLPLRQAIALC